jgi:hypothetical protein
MSQLGHYRTSGTRQVRFTPDSGHCSRLAACPLSANWRHSGAGTKSPSLAISSGEKSWQPDSSLNEGSRARQDNAYLGVFTGLAIDLYKPRMLLHDNVVSN